MRDGGHELVFEVVCGLGLLARVVLERKQFLASALGAPHLGAVFDGEQDACARAPFGVKTSRVDAHGSRPAAG